MFLTTLSFLGGTWLAASALFLYPFAPSRAALALLAGLLVMGLSVAAAWRPACRLAAGVVGWILAVAVFFLATGVADVANHLGATLLIAIGGLSPSPRVIPVPREAGLPVAPEGGVEPDTGARRAA